MLFEMSKVCLLLLAALLEGPAVLPAGSLVQPDRPTEQQVAPFPAELTRFRADPVEPIFAGRGPGHWDARIRERGWIRRGESGYQLWYTGYDGTREGIRRLGLATSADGIHWRRRERPLLPSRWVEDMMVVEQARTLWMFAEGRGDRACLLKSSDGVHWDHLGTIDVRLSNGEPIPAGPFGTPTAWFEDGLWYLFYERRDAGVWLATSRDMRVWTNVRDEPVLRPGPSRYDGLMIAMNQIVRVGDWYYAFYHGSGTPQKPRQWCTCLAASKDLIHWQKYSANPLQPVAQNKSSGVVIRDGDQWRLYTMHDQVILHRSVMDETSPTKGATLRHESTAPKPLRRTSQAGPPVHKETE